MTKLMTIVAMLGLVTFAFADSGRPAQRIPGARIAVPLAVGDTDPSDPSGDTSPNATNETFVAPPANDTCAGAVPLTLKIRVSATTVGANDDYQTPATAACYPGVQYPTTAPGRDVVFSFTAPAAGKYSFKGYQLDPTQSTTGQNPVAYLTDTCGGPGTVNCLAGAHRILTSSAFVDSKGQNNNRGAQVSCYPMSAGQTVYFIYDDNATGRCSDNSHLCLDGSYCNAGATCNPVLNSGNAFGAEVKPCTEESEPNNSPAQANPYVCDMTGSISTAPTGFCVGGTRAGNACTRSTFLDQSLADSDMRCSISNARCAVDLTLGTGNCPAGEGICQQHADLDCDPRCDVGPNAGLSCTTQAFCNPVSDQGATCTGACQATSTCVTTATGADTGVACTPVCVGGLFPGRFCSGLSGCPGGGVCTQTVLAPNPGGTCVAGQTCGRQYNEGDVDYYSIGSPAAGSKIFAGTDMLWSNSYDTRMRITTSTNTIGFDDDDGVWHGQLSPTIAGAVADGSPTFIQVAGTATGRTSATYNLYAIVRPPLASAQLEDETDPVGNDIYYGVFPFDIPWANPIDNGANNGYLRGTFAYQGDSDCFRFLANKGDLMDWYGDANPTRANIPVSGVDIPQPIVYDAEPAGISNFIFGAQARKNTAANVQGPGLRALSPSVTASYFQWRASYTGMLMVCYYGASAPLSQGTPSHPNSWAGSLSVNCGPVRAAGPGTTTADVSITKTGPAGPVTTGSFIDYTITITNNSNQIAQMINLQDTLDPNLTYIGLDVDDTLGGNNTLCNSLPTGGTNDAPIDCINVSMAPLTSTVYTLHVQVNNCIGDGVTITNTASIVTESTDTKSDNDSATHTFTTVAAPNNGCTPVFCSLNSSNQNICIPDHCTVNAQCDAGGACVGGDAMCDDNSLCTDDSCDPATGCVNDPTPGNLCDDFNACTINACDPILFCVYPPEPPTTSCDDGLGCTNSDHCDGAGTCIGTSLCDDNNPCSDDFCDETTHACSHAPSVSGTACDDGNSCTGTAVAPDSCDAAGHCVGGQPVSCDDGNNCTTDSCHAFLGCLNVSISCDDGNVCNGAESCNPSTGCVAGSPLVCNNGNACDGVETCNPATGCVGGSPVVCAAPDQCHVAGVCQPGSGTCTYGNKADGTTCDDGNSGTTNDVCTAGICAGSAACGTQPKPKSSGYYKKLCKNGQSHPYHGDELTAADAQCVGQLTSTFAGVSTVPELCAVLDHDSSVHHDSNGPEGKECQKAEAELMALALNICRGYVCPSQEVDSGCSGHDSHLNHTLTTVAASLATIDSILSDPNRSKDTCKDARCLAKEINNGKGIHHISLSLNKEPGTGGKLRLTWENPVMDDGSGQANSYTVWRRPLLANSTFTQVAVTNNVTWVDNTASTGTWEYEVTFTIQP